VSGGVLGYQVKTPVPINNVRISFSYFGMVLESFRPACSPLYIGTDGMR
jgi:hypothetical protein